MERDLRTALQRTIEAGDQVLTAEVAGGEELVVATRVLHYEAEVDMRVQMSTYRALLSGRAWWLWRRRYKWYVFSDEVLVCNQARDGLYHMKALLSLSEEDGLVIVLKDSKDVKPEAFFVNDSGLEYKCWARSVDEKTALLKLFEELRGEVRARVRESRT